MNFLEKYYPKKLPPLRFKSLLIISYARSGSTLLQGVLNSIDGVVIRGENMNMCYHLFEAFQAIKKAKVHNGKLIQSPFYGVELLDEKYFLNQTKETVKTLLLAGRKNDQNVKCYGFKEIRYAQIHNNLLEYLEFLNKIFPNVAFVFNTRNKEDVVNSWINLGWSTEQKKKETVSKIKKIEASFTKAMKTLKSNSFHITYEDVIGKTERVEELFSFLGAPFEESRIDKVLSLQHSYKPNQTGVKKVI